MITEIADCIESFCMEQAVVLAEICWLLLLAALEHNAACKTQEGAQYQQLGFVAHRVHLCSQARMSDESQLAPHPRL